MKEGKRSVEARSRDESGASVEIMKARRHKLYVTHGAMGARHVQSLLMHG